MRELNECTAEVFRRSERRIKARRRGRVRALVLCIPVCLIAAVWSAVALSPAGLVGDSVGSDRFQGEAAGNAPASPACPYDAVEIRRTGLFPEEQEHTGTVTDRPEVAEMFQAICALFADAAGSDQISCASLPALEENKSNGLIESAGKRKDYTITFTAGDGSRAVYTLRANILVNESTNETVFLSGGQAAGLLAVLGLSE